MKLPVYFFIVQESDRLTIQSLTLPASFEAKIHNYLNNNTLPAITKLFRESPPAVIYTVGANSFSELSKLPYDIRKHWLHAESVSAIKPSYITNCFMMALERTDQPLLSVITTTFHSGERILRPLRSLQAQTYTNWEWIIWDDSKDETTWQQLKQFELNDLRIRIYRASGNSGYIGQMKQLAGKLARGQWILELDHDDDIVPELFQWIIEASEKYPEAGFIYSDYLECQENTNEPFNYGDDFSFGYGSYYKKLLKLPGDTVGKWQNVCQSSPMNPKTFRHIVGVPNHIRCWRTDIYNKLGGHRHQLPVADDYELILRTMCITSWVRIAELGYIQYRNAGGNNFTFLRNQLIQDLTFMISSHYNTKIHKLLQDKSVPDTVIQQWTPNVKDWLVPTYEFPQLELVYKPDNAAKISLVLDAASFLVVNLEGPLNLIRTITSVINQQYKLWELFVIGYACPGLDRCMDVFVGLNDPRIKWWNLLVDPKVTSPKVTCRNYACKMLVQSDWVTYLDETTILTPDYLDTVMDIVEDESEDDVNIYYKGDIEKEFSLTKLVHHKDLFRQHGLFTEEDGSTLVHQWLSTEPYASL